MQDALADTEELLEEEIKERQIISQSILERNQQLEQLYAVDQRALPDKIQEKLTEILTLTITQKMEAQTQLQQEENKTYQYQQLYNQLKIQEKNAAKKAEELKNKEIALNQNIEIINQENQADEIELKNLEEQFENIKNIKKQIQNKYLQLKCAMERMNDVKTVLNRFFTNEDLFDEKMELKEQKITIKTQVQPRVVSREAKPKLKPINNNDGDDFWRMDFNKGKN